MFRNSQIYKVFFIIFIFLTFSFWNFIPVLGHGGNADTDAHYQISYSENDVSMKVSNIQIPLGGALEINVSITNINKSMTIIIEVAKNGGTVWGLYLENQSTYYNAKNSTDPQLFSTNGLSQCCTKLLDHVTYYATKHINRSIGENYVLALYNTHLHEETTAVFNIIILKGLLGEEVNLIRPPESDFLVSILILGLLTGIGTISVGLVVYVLILKPRRR